MSSHDLSNPWRNGGSLASYWNANDTVVLDSPAVGNPKEAMDSSANQADREIKYIFAEPYQHKQAAATCWAAALASWIPAQLSWQTARSANFSIQFPPESPEAIVELNREFLNPDGSLPYDNWPKIAERYNLDWVIINGSMITSQYIHNSLKNNGYLYWTYQPSGGGFSHVNIIYGVIYKTKNGKLDGVYIMEPIDGSLTFKFLEDINKIDKNLIALSGSGKQLTL